MAQLCHHLGKGRLIELSVRSLKFFRCEVLITILFDFTNPETTPLIVPPTSSMGPFPWWALLYTTQTAVFYLSVALTQTRTWSGITLSIHHSTKWLLSMNLSSSFLFREWSHKFSNHCDRDLRQITLFGFTVM